MAIINPVNKNKTINKKPKNRFPIIPAAIVLFVVILLLGGGIWLIINLISPKGRVSTTKTYNNYPTIQSTNIPEGYKFSGYFFVSPDIKEANDFHFMTQLSNQDKKSVIMRDEKIMESLGPYDDIEFFSFDPSGKNFIYITTDYESEDHLYLNGERVISYKLDSEYSFLGTGIQDNYVKGNEPKFSFDGKLLAYQVKEVDENENFLFRIVTMDVENKKVLNEKIVRDILFIGFTPTNELSYVSVDSLTTQVPYLDDDYTIHVGDKIFKFPYGAPEFAFKPYFSKDGKKLSYIMTNEDELVYASPLSAGGLYKNFNSYIITIDLQSGVQKKSDTVHDYIFISHTDYGDDNEFVYLAGKSNNLTVYSGNREIYKYTLKKDEDVYGFTLSPNGRKYALTLSQKNDKSDEDTGSVLVDNIKVPDAWDIIFYYDGSKNVYQFLKKVKGNNRAFLKYGKVEIGPFDDPYRQILSTNGKFLAIGESSANLRKKYVLLVREDGKVWMSDPFDGISDLKFNGDDTFFYFSGISNNTIYKVIFPLDGFDQSAKIITVNKASDFLRNIYVTELPERERKARDSKRVSDIMSIGFAIEGLENGSILESNVGIPLQGCTKAHSLISDCSGPDIGHSFFTEYSDPSGVTTPCTPQGDGVCAYSISSKDGLSGPKIGDYQICFFLEGDMTGMKIGPNSRVNGIMKAGCN